MRNLRFILGCIILALLGSLIAFAQTTLGIIAGTVTDSSGAVVVGATVTVQRSEGGEPRTATTGPTGDYRVESLTPGTYSVKVTAERFSSTEFSNVVVNASVTTPVSVRLSVGATTEMVTVDASVQQVQTDNGQIDAVIPTAQVRDLPIVGGNPYSLAITLPGVSQPDQRDNFTNGSGFSVNGLRPRANNFLIDGFDNNDYGITGQALQPTNQEAVASVTVLQNSYAAEYGRGGGSVSNLTFLSGTNTFHGAAWEQYSGAALNAVTAEQQQSGITSPPHQVNNLYGFKVGGPIVKNKLFFFGTSQWTHQFGAPTTASTLTIPTANGIATLQQVLAGSPNNTNVQILLNSLGGLVAPTALGPVQLADEPGCTGCSVDFGRFTRTDSTQFKSYEWTARGDYTASEHDQIFARFTDTYSSFAPDLFANPAALPTQDTQQAGPARNLGVMWAHTFTPTVLNEFRFSQQTIAFHFDATAKTLANPLAHAPSITFSSSDTFGGGVVALGGFSAATFPQGREHQTYQFQDAVSIVKGTHSVKIGADVTTLLVQDQIPFNSDGTALFSSGGNCTVNGVVGSDNCTDLANYVDGFSGSTGNVQLSFGNPRLSTPTSQQAYYFQDSWKIRPNFTLDYGLRYEYQPPDAENGLAFPAIDRNTALTANPLQRVEVKPYRNAWGPRLGFSYAPRFFQGLLGENKTVIRGGAGVFYDTFFTNISNNSAATFPNASGGELFGADVPGRGLPQALDSISTIPSTLDPTNLREPVTDNLRNPRIYQWNLNVQRELPGRLIAQVAYVGTRATGEFANEQFNPRINSGSLAIPGPRENPNFGSIVVRGNRGDSIYHGLQTEVTRNVGRLSLRGSYTWSRSIDNSSEIFVTCGGATRWENVKDPRSDRGPSCFNHTNVAAFTWVYALPGPSKGFLNAALGGWVTSGSIVLQSGAPETLFFGGIDVNGDGEGFNDRPSIVNPSVPVNVSACLSNPACTSTGIGLLDTNPTDIADFGLLSPLTDLFTGAPVSMSQVHYLANVGHNGNLGRNSINLPGLEQYNLSVLKNFKMPFGESHQLQVRADFLNAFNHFNAGQNAISGYGDLLSPGFGFLGPKSLTLDGGRSIQVWMKYNF